MRLVNRSEGRLIGFCRPLVGTVLAYRDSAPPEPQPVGVWDPGSIPRYVHCDCIEESPCRHVPLAVRAFRLWNAARENGLISTQEAKYSPPVETVEECEQLVQSLFECGLANLPLPDLRRREALPASMRRRGLLWPAEIAAELVLLRAQYLQRDALFDPARAVHLVSGLLLRMRAIRSPTGSVPQLLLRGSAKDEAVDLSFARREFPNPEQGDPKSFAALAGAAFSKSASYAAIGAGNLLMQGAKRTVNGEVTAARARISISPQSFEWEKLRSPSWWRTSRNYAPVAKPARRPCSPRAA